MAGLEPGIGPAWLGDRAVVVGGPGLPGTPTSLALALSRALDSADVVVRAGMTEVLVESRVPRDSLLDDVASVLPTCLEPDGGPVSGTSSTHSLHVDYAGSDLATAATSLGLTPDELVSAHVRQSWRVAMVGFAPGFGYLVPVGEPLADWAGPARLAVPRERVPAGSVAVAAGMSAVYPADMPGGWHLLGTCRQRVFDAERADRPSLLAAGDLVHFVVAGTS